MPDVFEKRLRRAEFLEKEWPFSAELLRFFRRITEFQGGLSSIAHDPSFRALGDRLPAFCELLEREGPPPLAARAAELKAAPGPELLRRAWDQEDADPLVRQIAVLMLEPWAMTQAHATPHGPPSGTCPRCRALPRVSLLREDKIAETVRRTLICSLCSLEWEFARVLCPSCPEEKPEKLPRFSAQEIPWMRVEACDSCGKYLKSVDLTLNWDAEPVVDELASTPLDVIAHEHGYVKITPNLAGI
jgi:formate dehydrogenase maturation protein FdhE